MQIINSVLKFLQTDNLLIDSIEIDIIVHYFCMTWSPWR